MPIGVRIGDREIFLLSMLIDKQLYGYQIAQMLNDHASFFIEIDQSGVYNALRKLEKQGWVAMEPEKAGNAPARKLYRITQSGKKELETFLLDEPNQTRLNILGTLNLLNNSSWLPSEKLMRHLSARILALQSLMSTESGGHDAIDNDPTSDYLRALMQIEVDFATVLQNRTR